MKQVLMVLPFSPNPIRYGITEVVAQFRRFAEVDILCLNEGTSIRKPDGVRRLTAIPNTSKVARIFRILTGVLRGYPVGSEFYNCLRLPSVLAKMDLGQYDVIYVKRLPLHRLRITHPSIIYDADDCWAHKSRKMAEAVGGYQSLIYRLDSVLAPRQEAATCNAASVVIAVAEREVAHLRSEGVISPIKTFMHGSLVDLPPRPLEKRERIVLSFHGKLSYKPNEIALAILNNSIAPKLDQGRYDIRVFGQCPPEFPARFPALKFSGYVESMPEALRESDISVFPLTMSTGFSTKAWESLATGVPLIVTPGVIEGLPAMPELLEQGVYVRELGDFAAEIERFSRMSIEQRIKISENCKRYVERTGNQAARDAQWDEIMAVLHRTTAVAV